VVLIELKWSVFTAKFSTKLYICCRDCWFVYICLSGLQYVAVSTILCIQRKQCHNICYKCVQVVHYHEEEQEPMSPEISLHSQDSAVGIKGLLTVLQTMQ
jgi:hypothetical protein